MCKNEVRSHDNFQWELRKDGHNYLKKRERKIHQ